MDVEIGFEFGVGLSMQSWHNGNARRNSILGLVVFVVCKSTKSALEAQSSDGAWSPLSRQPVGESLPVNQPPGGLQWPIRHSTRECLAENRSCWIPVCRLLLRARP